MSAPNKWVYAFGGGTADGEASMRNLLGGKGANLAEMSNLGLPVPPGFTITTEVCTAFYQNDGRYPEDLKAQVEAALEHTGTPLRPVLEIPNVRYWCLCVQGRGCPCLG